MMRTSLGAVVAALLLAGAVTGCGAGGGSGDADSKTGPDEAALKRSACEKWEQTKPFEDQANEELQAQLSGGDNLDALNAANDAFEAQADLVREAFNKAADADPAWDDVQEAAFAVLKDYNGDVADSQTKVDAACDCVT